MNQFAVKYNLRDRGMKYENLMVLRETQLKIPGFLYEPVFVDNIHEAKLLKDDKFFNALSNEISYALKVALGVA